MQRTLLLVRHAKSSWEEAGLPDRARPLAPRGLRDAPLMGGRLARAGVKPDLILSSPACRALSTARLIAGALGYPISRIAVDDRLYVSDVDTLLEVAGEFADTLGCVMLVGHDPEFTALAHRFSSKITRMPTCAVACFTFDAPSWSALAARSLKGVSFDYPRLHRDERGHKP